MAEDKNEINDTGEIHDPYLDGNDAIEAAISTYHTEPTRDSLYAVLNTIRDRMHADGHFMIPVEISDDGKEFTFRAVHTKDGKEWLVAFTSPEEYKKGQPSQIMSNFIDSMIKACLGMECAGIVINPWDQDFMLAKELIEMIIEADGDVEYHVPDDDLTPELLEGGTYLKRAIEICNRNRTQLNMIKLLKILRDSYVWIPCNVILSETDKNAFDKVVKDAIDNNDLDSIVGTTMISHDEIRMVPDILQNGDQFFFPVFTSAEEMGEYGNGFSKIESHFLHATNLARNNEKNVFGIVINAFSEPFVISKDLFDLVARMPSAFEESEKTKAEEHCDDPSASQPASDKDDFKEDELLYFSRNKGKGGKAIGKITDDGFWVLKGSYIYPEVAEYAPTGVVSARKQYSDQIDNKGILQQDICFSSPSYAAAFVCGKNCNGLVEWKNKNGITLKELNSNISPSVKKQ